MAPLSLHPWNVTTAQAREIQLDLASRVIREDRLGPVRLVAGADISKPDADGLATAAVVVMDIDVGAHGRAPLHSVVAVRTVRLRPEFPYVPGLLSFREAPLVLAAWDKLESKPDLLLVDGQGLAHPRRMGIACHLGLLLDIPTIGCAKSRLIGEHGEMGQERGQWAEMRDGEEVIGAAVRTRTNVRPIYVSTGHRVNLETAIEWALACCRGYRIPEPLRLAHQAAGKKQA